MNNCKVIQTITGRIFRIKPVGAEETKRAAFQRKVIIVIDDVCYILTAANARDIGETLIAAAAEVSK